MGIIECSQPASKSSWYSQDFGEIIMVLKMAHFRKSTGPRWVNVGQCKQYNISSHLKWVLVADNSMHMTIYNKIHIKNT